MATTADEQRRMHGKQLSEAAKTEHADAVPGSDAAHAHSHAAHAASEGNVHVAPEGIGKQAREAGSLNQPPQDPGRNGKARGRD